MERDHANDGCAADILATTGFCNAPMVSLKDVTIAITQSSAPEYCCSAPLDVYKTPDCRDLVTQAAIGRQLRILQISAATAPGAIRVLLCADDYPGWIPVSALPSLRPAIAPYAYQPVDAATVQRRMPQVMAFAHAAQAQPNQYRWGGTIGPDYDCSGLVQAAFASAGIILPRDSYQQAAFVQPVDWQSLIPGDLLFFSERDRITHVALYLGNNRYIHSSGKDSGRNGIGIDSLVDLEDAISHHYYQQLQGAGRVVKSYQAQGRPMPCR